MSRQTNARFKMGIEHRGLRPHVCSVCTKTWYEGERGHSMLSSSKPSTVEIGDYSVSGLCPECADRVIDAVGAEICAIRAPLNLRSSEPHVVSDGG